MTDQETEDARLECLEVKAKAFEAAMSILNKNMIKYIAVAMIISAPSFAETGNFRACAGAVCRQFDVQLYAADEIRTMHPAVFCSTTVRVPPSVNGHVPLKRGYSVGKDCARLANMTDGYNFKNPELR